MPIYRHGDFLKGDLIQNIDSGTLFKVKKIEGKTIHLVNGTRYRCRNNYRPKWDWERWVQIVDNDFSKILIELPYSIVTLEDGDRHNYIRISPEEASDDERIRHKRALEGTPVDWEKFDKNPDCFDPPMRPDYIESFLRKQFRSTSGIRKEKENELFGDHNWSSLFPNHLGPKWKQRNSKKRLESYLENNIELMNEMLKFLKNT